jgi:probable F420-dependent oxidoreductase
MKIGFGLMGVSPRRYPPIVARADELGFDAVWQPEHLIWPATMPPQYPYAEDGYPPVTVNTPTFDPWVNLAFVASHTKNIMLGTNIYILPLRDPFVTARAITTLDFLSSGRVLAGVGVGWLEDEFVLTGLDYHTRGARTDEIIQILRKLWTEEVTEFHGKHYNFGPVRFVPKPVAKPHPPILVGGDSEAAIRRAARYGDGWISIGRGAEEEFDARVKRLHELRRAYGRDHLPFDVVTGAGPDPTVDSLRRLEERGATRITVQPWPPPERGSPTVEHAIAGLERFAERILSKLT